MFIRVKNKVLWQFVAFGFTLKLSSGEGVGEKETAANKNQVCKMIDQVADVLMFHIKSLSPALKATFSG